MTTEDCEAMTDLSRMEPLEIATTASLVSDRIRDGIIDGTFLPGSRIAEAQLSQRLSVSRGPVREAMQRLIQEGLLRAERNRGVFVVDLGPEDIEDVFVARETIELRAVEELLGAEWIDAEIANLERIVERMDAAADTREWPRMCELDLEFHEALVAATRRHRLVRMYRTLVAETQICMMRLESAYANRADLVDEHREIVEALRDRDGDRASRSIETHFELGIRAWEKPGRAPSASGH